jgi:hypothetical protein
MLLGLQVPLESEHSLAPLPTNVAFDGATMLAPYSQDSPDSISMAFPPLPPAFESNSGIHACDSQPQQQASDLPPSAGLYRPDINTPMALNESSQTGMNNLDSFLNYNYLLS